MLLLLALACTAPTDEVPTNTDAAGDSTEASRGDRPPDDPSVLPPPDRPVGSAAVHGDLQAPLAVLQLARLVDDQRRRAGGETVAVQTA